MEKALKKTFLLEESLDLILSVQRGISEATKREERMNRTAFQPEKASMSRHKGMETRG